MWGGHSSPRSASQQATQPSPDGDWHEALHNLLAAEEYFYVLLWQRRWALAAEYATRMATRLEELKLAAPEWIERYEDSLRKNPWVQSGLSASVPMHGFGWAISTKSGTRIESPAAATNVRRTQV